MASLFRSLRALPITKTALRPQQIKFTPIKAFSTSIIRSAGAGPPQLLGPGAKAGEIPTE